MGSLLRKNSPVLRTGRVGFSPRHRRRVSAPERWSPSTRRNREIEEEVQKIETLVGEISASLRRSEEKIDLHLESIGRTLRELAEQREKIRGLERELGIERPGA